MNDFNLRKAVLQNEKLTDLLYMEGTDVKQQNIDSTSPLSGDDPATPVLPLCALV